MTQFLAVYENSKGERECWIYNSWSAFHNDTFSPENNVVYILDMSKIAGKTYREKQAELRSKAIEYSNMIGEIYPISMGETKVIDDFFEKYGRRYGLLTEFRENAIC